jgi:hypothetical protein
LIKAAIKHIYMNLLPVPVKTSLNEKYFPSVPKAGKIDSNRGPFSKSFILSGAKIHGCVITIY